MPATTEINANNPIGLTVNGPNSFLYPGQTSVLRNPLSGLYFAGFPNPQTGWQAAIGYLSSPKRSNLTIGQLAQQNFDGNRGPANAGFDLSSLVSSVDPASLAAAISKGEGTFGALGSALSSVGNFTMNTATAANNAANSSNPFAFLQSFFSINTAQRATAVVIGAVLALIAIAILISETKTGQAIIAQAKDAAKDAAAGAVVAA